MRSLAWFCIFCGIVLSVSCGDDDDDALTPRPEGYFRIALPEKKYVVYNAECPFSFEIPDYAHVYHSAAPMAEPCWRDLFFAPFKATVYISYKEITNDTLLEALVNQSWQLTEAHSQVASGLRDSLILRPDAHVYGDIQSLAGNAATQVQFYLTDSTKHFLRGSLYFYCAPNKDSIAPVLDFVKKDIYHLAYTLQWNDRPLPVDEKRAVYTAGDSVIPVDHKTPGNKK
ncbi:MAG TPA: gliding motility lipoprotein GldD [Bacteroidia bacterium]|nr:gliding motility lipoprotein GldD [Bacteroidia bacterium]